MEFDFERFVSAQERTWEQARAELRAGAKRSHWMWFIFPQLRGLGTSAMAERYALGSIEQARAFLAHPVLGPRLRELTGVVNESGKPVDAVFAYPDDLKFHSSVTLFAEASGGEDPFAATLRRCFSGQKDPATVRLLGAGQPGSR